MIDLEEEKSGKAHENKEQQRVELTCGELFYKHLHRKVSRRCTDLGSTVFKLTTS